MRESVPLAKKVIAITGKGGVGKTALSVMMVKVLKERFNRPRLLLIDGDPAMGLPTALGLEVTKTIGRAREAIINAARTDERQETVRIAGMLDYLILEALVEMDGFSLLVMGRTETLGCFCPVNDLLRSAIETLTGSFDIILIDCEAGLEQINRQVVRSVDELIIITDATIRGIKTAALIDETAKTYKTLQNKRTGLVINRSRGEDAVIARVAGKAGLKVFGSIPEDGNIAGYDLVGKPLSDIPDDSPALIAVRKIVETIFSA